MNEKDLQRLKRVLGHIENQIVQKKNELKKFETHSGCSYRADTTEEVKVVCEEHKELILKEFPELKNRGGK